jgi:hypothetical protein
MVERHTEKMGYRQLDGIRVEDDRHDLLRLVMFLDDPLQRADFAGLLFDKRLPIRKAKAGGRILYDPPEFGRTQYLQ